MTIADKLALIAENEQKVFNAGGGGSGSTQPTLFTPSIVFDSGTTVLTITDDRNGDFERWYNLFSDDERVATLTSKTATLSDYIESSGAYKLKVQVASQNFTSSEFSNIVKWIVPTEGLIYGVSYNGTSAYFSNVGTSTSSKIVISSTYNGLPVTEIGYTDKTSYAATYIFIPNTIYSINQSWFEDLSYRYPNLKAIEVDEDNNKYSSKDGVLYGFDDDDHNVILRYPPKKGTSFVIPDNVYVVGEGAFAGCSGLTSITLHDTLGRIENKAFAKCSGLTSITIPDIGSIGEDAFLECTGLTSITIPKSVLLIGDNYISSKRAFGNCTSLKSIDVASDNPTYSSINGNLYDDEGTDFLQYACGKAEKEFSIPAGVKRIGGYAFDGCANLEKIVVPDSVTFMSPASFNSESIKIIVMGNGYTEISWLYNPFYCKNLKRLDFSRSNQVVKLTSSTIFNSIKDFQVKVPESLFTEWKNAEYWSAIADKIVKEFTNTL